MTDELIELKNELRKAQRNLKKAEIRWERYKQGLIADLEKAQGETALLKRQYDSAQGVIEILFKSNNTLYDRLKFYVSRRNDY